MRIKLKTNSIDWKCTYAINDLLENIKRKNEKKIKEEEIRVNMEKKGKSKQLKEDKLKINKSFKDKMLEIIKK